MGGSDPRRICDLSQEEAESYLRHLEEDYLVLRRQLREKSLLISEICRTFLLSTRKDLEGPL